MERGRKQKNFAAEKITYKINGARLARPSTGLSPGTSDFCGPGSKQP